MNRSEQHQAENAKNNESPASPAAMGLRMRLPARPLTTTVSVCEEAVPKNAPSRV